ncbi:MAG: hypothetical protein E3J35_11610 [Methanomassiliicoccales archaeon]|nr:MAG: hypothetical protein E3J35_11610 [Methanomassiliicoccales archaeon]
MSQIWPFDVKIKESLSPREGIRYFRCLYLYPVKRRFEEVAEILEEVVTNELNRFRMVPATQPAVERIDLVTSSEIIQEEIWTKVLDADLIFCDITGYNPNVMFECGVCAAWKRNDEVKLIKDHFFKQESAFDIAPKRYIEYEMTSRGRPEFVKKVRKLVEQALIRYPDGRGRSPEISLPLELDFRDSRDTGILYTPPFAHRRAIGGRLEFGSSQDFSHSWASLGKKRFRDIDLEFEAKFSNAVNEEEAWIGVGLRSHHCFAPFGHILYLRANGMIIIAQPNDMPPQLYQDIRLRNKMPIDTDRDHLFRISFDDRALEVEVDGFSRSFRVRDMPKVFKDGLIRFQAYYC